MTGYDILSYVLIDESTKALYDDDVSFRAFIDRIAEAADKEPESLVERIVTPYYNMNVVLHAVYDAVQNCGSQVAIDAVNNMLSSMVDDVNEVIVDMTDPENIHLVDDETSE